jgi:hypothetical protein
MSTCNCTQSCGHRGPGSLDAFLAERFNGLLEMLCDLSDDDRTRRFIEWDNRQMERRAEQRRRKPFRHHRRKSHGLTKGFHHKQSLWPQ